MDKKTQSRLRIRAAYHGRFMEEEATEILPSALTAAPAANTNLVVTIRGRFAEFGGVELQLPRRDTIRHKLPRLARRSNEE